MGQSTCALQQPINCSLERAHSNKSGGLFSVRFRLPGMCFNQPMSFMFAGELLRRTSQGITDDSSSNGLDNRDLTSSCWCLSNDRVAPWREALHVLGLVPFGVECAHVRPNVLVSWRCHSFVLDVWPILHHEAQHEHPRSLLVGCRSASGFLHHFQSHGASQHLVLLLYRSNSHHGKPYLLMTGD